MAIRKPNFSLADKTALVDLVEIYAEILEDKKKDSVNQQKKKQTWFQLALDYNQDGRVMRLDEELINCWTSLKKKAREYCGLLKQDNYGTGGGKKKTTPDPLLERVAAIIGISASGHETIYDRDGPTTHTGDILNDTDEGCHPLDVFEHMKDYGGINPWNKWQIDNLKTKMSPPLEEEAELMYGNLHTQGHLNKENFRKRKATCTVTRVSNNHPTISISDEEEPLPKFMKKEQKIQQSNEKTVESCRDHETLIPLYKQKIQLEIALLQAKILRERLETNLIQRKTTSTDNPLNDEKRSSSSPQEDNDDADST